MKSFSKRHGYINKEVDITVRESAPSGLRCVVIDMAEDDCCLDPSILRQVICRVLHESPDLNNWSEYPNIDREVRYLIENCEWHKVYDIIERLYAHLIKYSSQGVYSSPEADLFQNEINDYFFENGIGWKLIDGQIEMRGEEAFEKTMKSAQEQLESSDEYSTASKELHEAIIDLSRRPIADTTGAIQHAMASLECVAREISGERTLTLGKIMARKKITIPPPLDEAITKAWGFASEYGRHLQEGRNPEFEEAELIVGICASVGNYLVKKSQINED